MGTFDSQARRTVRVALLIWAAAIAMQTSVLVAQEKMYFPYALACSILYYGLLGLMAIPVWRVCLRLPERQLPLRRVIGIHIWMGLTVVFVWEGVFHGIMILLGDDMSRLRDTWLWQILTSIITYSVMVAAMLAFQTSRLLTAQKRREAELQIVARDAEIRALKLMIRPHFFFNAMNAIYSLIQTRPKEAQEMVELLAALMRQTLEAAEDDLVSLDCELETVKTYLQIEKVRFGERLTVRMDPNGIAPDWAVPPFLLQPLVENAIKHGIAPKPGHGEIDVFVRAQDDQLEFTVRDTGPGIRPAVSADDREGHGLSIVRRRLQTLYGQSFSIVQRNLEAGGFEVSIRIPQQKLGEPLAMQNA